MCWGVFLGSVGLAGALNVALAVQAVRVVRSGPFALTLGGWATTAGLACIYTVNKIVDLALTELDIEDNWYTERQDHLADTCSAHRARGDGDVCVFPAVDSPTGCDASKCRSAATWLAARQEYPEFALPGRPTDHPMAVLDSSQRPSIGLQPSSGTGRCPQRGRP